MLQCVFKYLCVKMGITGCVFQPSVLFTQYVYDSLKTKICPHVIKQASALIQSAEHSIFFVCNQYPHQKGTSDCELFTVATATALCFGFVPNHTEWNQGITQKLLLNCFEVGKMEPYPVGEAASKGVYITSTTKVKIYCSCTCMLPYGKQ